MICIDTNVVIAVLRQEPIRLLERFTSELSSGSLALSTVVLFELHYGVANSARQKDNADRLAVFLQAPITVLPFEQKDAEEAGKLRAELKRSGTPIGPYDILIAAQARRRDALLATANTDEFVRVKGLRIENWAAA